MHDNIQNQIKDALRAKDSIRLLTLRGVLTAFTNESLNLGRKPQDKLTDEEAVLVVKKLAKQRKDSIEQFEKGGRNDLAENEKKELSILEEFLPGQMKEEEIKSIVLSKKEELKIEDKSKIGILIGAVVKATSSRADGAIVKKIVEEILK